MSDRLRFGIFMAPFHRAGENPEHTAAFPQMDVGSSSAVREAIDFVNESGLGSIGTPDDAVEQIERLQKQSGGFGCSMTLSTRGRTPRRHAAATS